MVESTVLGCGPLKPQWQNRIKPAFGSQERASEIPESPGDGFEKKGAGCDSCGGAGCPACQTNSFKKFFEPFKNMSLEKAGEQFWKGIVSPAEAIIDSPLVAAVTVAIGLGIAKIVKKYNLTKVTKLSILASAGIAVYNLGKGLYNFAVAETAEGKENSFYNIGQGMLYGTLAIYPAKLIGLKDGVPGVTKDTTRVKSFWQCLKSIPGDIKQISRAIGGIITGDKSVKSLQTTLGPYAGATVVGTEAINGSAASFDTPDITISGSGSDDSVLSPDLEKKMDTVRHIAGQIEDDPMKVLIQGASNDNSNETRRAS